MKTKYRFIVISMLLAFSLVLLSMQKASCQSPDSWVNIQVISFDGQNIFFNMNIFVRGNHVDGIMWVETEGLQSSDSSTGASSGISISSSANVRVSRVISNKVFEQGNNLTVFSYSYAYNNTYYKCEPKVWGYVLFPYDKHDMTLILSSNFNFTLDQHPSTCVVPSSNYDGSFQVTATSDPTVYNIGIDIQHSPSFETGYFWILTSVLVSLYGLSIFLFVMLFVSLKNIRKMGGDIVRVSSAMMFFVPAFEIAFNAVKAPLPLVFSDILLILIIPLNAVVIILAVVFKHLNASHFEEAR